MMVAIMSMFLLFGFNMNVSIVETFNLMLTFGPMYIQTHILMLVFYILHTYTYVYLFIIISSYLCVLILMGIFEMNVLNLI